MNFLFFFLRPKVVCFDYSNVDRGEMSQIIWIKEHSKIY